MSDRPDPVLLEYTQDTVAAVDADGTFRYVNGAAEHILGYDPADLLGQAAFDYIHPDARAEAVATFESVVAADEERTETMRYRHRTADGGWVWLESRFSNLTDPALGGYVVVSRDVTETVEAQRERDETRRRLEELTRSVSDVLWMFDDDWDELLFVNPAFEDVYGMPVGRLDGDPTTFLEAVHPDDVPRVREAMAQLSAGEAVDMEYRVNEARDYGVSVWVQAEPVVEDGEVARIVGFARDVTDRKRRERQLAVMDNLLRHNLRNDMTVILGQAEFVARRGDADVAEHAEIIRSEGEQLLESARKQRDIIDVLTGRATTGRLDLADVVEGAVAAVTDRHPRATIRTSVEDGLACVAVEELRVAVEELLENAIQHDTAGGPEDIPPARAGGAADTPRTRADGGPTVSVATRADGDRVLVEVTDQGPPIPEEEYGVLTGERAMDDVYHSTGLGLWLVYWVVDLSDGRVDFRRAESGGNVVSVSLRRADGG